MSSKWTIVHSLRPSYRKDGNYCMFWIENMDFFRLQALFQLFLDLSMNVHLSNHFATKINLSVPALATFTHYKRLYPLPIISTQPHRIFFTLHFLSLAFFPSSTQTKTITMGNGWVLQHILWYTVLFKNNSYWQSQGPRNDHNKKTKHICYKKCTQHNNYYNTPPKLILQDELS